jgi:hypothetical protein
MTFDAPVGIDSRTVCEDGAGGYLMAGVTHGCGYIHTAATRVNAEAEVLWSYSYPYPAVFTQQTHSVAAVPSGGFVIAGEDNRRMFLFKLSETGAVEWYRTYGHSSGGDLYAYAVLPAAGGGFLLTGKLDVDDPFGSLSYKAVQVVKTDNNGMVQWSYTYSPSATLNEYKAEGKAAVATPDGGYVITGIYQGPFPIDYDWEVLLMKIDGSGNLLWMKTYAGADYEGGLAVATLPGGDFGITGFTQSFGATDTDLLLMRTDGQGNLKWLRRFDNAYHDRGYGLAACPDGGIAVCGITGYSEIERTDALLLKTDSIGNLQWVGGYGNPTSVSTFPDKGLAVVPKADGSFILGGLYSDYYQYYLIQTDASGVSGCKESDLMPAFTSATGTPVVTDAGYRYLDTVVMAQQSSSAQNMNLSRTVHCSDNATALEEDEWVDYGISLFPVPADQFLMIHFAKGMDGILGINLYQSSGLLVRSVEPERKNAMNTDPHIGINLERLSPGMYVLEVQMETGERLSKSILIGR